MISLCLRDVREVFVSDFRAHPAARFTSAIVKIRILLGSLLTHPFHCSNVNEHELASGSMNAMSVASQAGHIVNPLCVAAGAAGANAACKNINSDDKLNLDELPEQEKIVDKEILKNGEAGACNTDNIDIDSDEQAYHNAGTMRYRKKTGSDHTDLDSIEHLDFDDDDKKHEGLEDDIDSVRFTSSCLKQFSDRFQF